MLLIEIDKLNHSYDNYKVWSRQVRSYFEAQEFWDLVANGPDSTIEIKKSTEDYIRYIILSLVDDEICEEIATLDSCLEMWTMIGYHSFKATIQ